MLSSGTLLLPGVTGSAAALPGGDRGYRPPIPVIDSEDADPDPAVMMNGLDIAISDWIVYGSETVADHNPTYDPDVRVTIVVFEHFLESGMPDWRRARHGEIFDGVVDRGVKFHAFPRSRLSIRMRRGRGNDKERDRRRLLRGTGGSSGWASRRYPDPCSS